MKSITINGKEFQLIEQRLSNRMTLRQADRLTECNKSLWEKYTSVSSSKAQSYREWMNFKTLTNMESSIEWYLSQFDVESATRWSYSLSGIAHNKVENKYYYIKITKDSNKAYLLLDESEV